MSLPDGVKSGNELFIQRDTIAKNEKKEIMTFITEKRSWKSFKHEGCTLEMRNLLYFFASAKSSFQSIKSGIQRYNKNNYTSLP